MITPGSVLLCHSGLDDVGLVLCLDRPLARVPPLTGQQPWTTPRSSISLVLVLFIRSLPLGHRVSSPPFSPPYSPLISLSLYAFSWDKLDPTFRLDTSIRHPHPSTIGTKVEPSKKSLQRIYMHDNDHHHVVVWDSITPSSSPSSSVRAGAGRVQCIIKSPRRVLSSFFLPDWVTERV